MKGAVLKRRILLLMPGVLIFASVIVGDKLVTEKFTELPPDFPDLISTQANEKTLTSTSIGVTNSDFDLQKEAETEKDENAFDKRLEYFSFIEPIAGTFFDTEANYVYNLSISTEISPIIENPFDTELEQLTAILKPIAVSETLGMTRNDLFSDMFRDKLGRLLVSAFNAAMYDAGYEKIVSRVEIIDFWSP